ncbi:hypothetical protein SAMN05443544_3272 [Agromyces cerinus subsp. cerinus]|uniref:Uncharacterized protein n=1 Tax=Agromyces cerinus subsp. cerinus TaxID=232089 RepID=A0A1N6HKM3_9MICO|nr:hypothetical protein SAMN05443544_3272 [Agromyces cerinus subsp. cerinus]
MRLERTSWYAHEYGENARSHPASATWFAIA